MSRQGFKESAYSFAAQWPYLRYLGMGAWWGWIWLCYSSAQMMRFFPLESRPQYVLTMYLLSTIGIASMMLVAALTWKRSTALIRRRGVIIGFSILASLATAALGYAPFLGGRVTFIVAAALTGIGTSALCLKCGDIYGSIAMRESLIAGSTSLIIASFLYFMGIGIPEDLRIVFIALLPVVSALLLVMPGDDPFPADERDVDTHAQKPAGRKTFLRLVIAAGAVAFTAGVGKGISSVTIDASTFSFIGTMVTFLIPILAVLIIWMVNRGDIVRSTRRVYSMLMLLGIVILLAAFFGFDLSYLNIGKETLWMVFSCFMAYMAFRFDMSSVHVFGLGQATYFLSSTAGWWIGSIITLNADAAYTRGAICIIFAFLIVLLLTFVFTDSDIKFILTWRENGPSDKKSSNPSDATAEAADKPAQVSDATDIPTQVARLSPSFGLSSRELEILTLFAQGRSANWIADELTVSKNTVRSHLRSIYVKLDIHSRQELLDLLSRS